MFFFTVTMCFSTYPKQIMLTKTQRARVLYQFSLTKTYNLIQRFVYQNSFDYGKALLFGHKFAQHSVSLNYWAKLHMISVFFCRKFSTELSLFFLLPDLKAITPEETYILRFLKNLIFIRLQVCPKSVDF